MSEIEEKDNRGWTVKVEEHYGNLCWVEFHANADEYWPKLERRLTEVLIGHKDEIIAQAPDHAAAHLLHIIRTRHSLGQTAVVDWEKVKKHKRSVTKNAEYDDDILQFVRSLGTDRTLKNRYYNEAGSSYWGLLKWAGLPYAASEAVIILWHLGAQLLATEDGVEVIDPGKKRTVMSGKDLRDPLESDAHKRWSRHRRRKGAPHWSFSKGGGSPEGSDSIEG